MNAEQERCIVTLAEWAGGRHHLPKIHEWGTGVCINWHGDLSTFDFDRLTRLVILAHRDAVRIQIGPSGPGLVRIMAHPRKHGKQEHMFQRHSSLDDLIASATKAKP